MEERRERARQRERERERSAKKERAQRLTVPGSTTEALALARDLGWTATPVTCGWRLTHPSGASTTIHKTLSDKRAWNNIVADLTRPLKDATKGRTP